MRVAHNVMPQKGTTIDESFTTTTSGYSGGAPFIGEFTMGKTEQMSVIEARIVGVSNNGSDQYVAREHRTVLGNGDIEVLVTRSDLLIQDDQLV